MTNRTYSTITEARLRRALSIVALAIECHGDVYWPIFEALKAELDTLKNRHAQLSEFRKTPNLRHITTKIEKVRPAQS